jgi:hypothetical protein
MIHRLGAEQLGSLAEPRAESPGPGRHADHLWSRRRFLYTGGALIGATAVAPLLTRAAAVAAPANGIPSPIPGFSPVLQSITGLEIPFFLPIEVDPFAGAFDPVSDPSTITDFNGFLGLVEADGVSDAEHNADGTPRRWACDVRFMEGVFVDRSGRTQRGAFGFF